MYLIELFYFISHMLDHFVPQSLDFSQQGEIRTTPDTKNGAVEIEIKNKQGDIGAVMSGQRGPSKDYALVFNGREFWIEKVSSTANTQMKEESKRKSQPPRGKSPATTAQLQQQQQQQQQQYQQPSESVAQQSKIRIQLPQNGSSNSAPEPPLTPGGSSRRTRTSLAAASSTTAAAAAASSFPDGEDNPFPDEDVPVKLSESRYGDLMRIDTNSRPINEDIESSSDSDSDSDSE